MIHDAGFQTYSQTLAIRPDDLETLRPCLEAFVPVVQRSAVEFVTDPARTNAAIVDIVEQYDTFWVYTPSSPSSRCRRRPSSASPATAPTR